MPDQAKFTVAFQMEVTFNENNQDIVSIQFKRTLPPDGIPLPAIEPIKRHLSIFHKDVEDNYSQYAVLTRRRHAGEEFVLESDTF